MIEYARRARDYHIYTNSGRRLLDMDLNSGTAIYGHRPANMLANVKRIISRGGSAFLPHPEAGRAEKEIRRLVQLLLPALQPELQEWRLRYLPCVQDISMLASLCAHLETPMSVLDCWAPAEIRQSPDEQLASLLLLRPGWSIDQLQKQLSACALPGRLAAIAVLLPAPLSCAPLPVLLPPSSPTPFWLQKDLDELQLFLARFAAGLFLQPAFPSFSPKRSDILLYPQSLASRGWKSWAESGPYQYWIQGFDDDGMQAYASIQAAALAKKIALPQDPRQPALMPALISTQEDAILNSLQGIG
jgi:hypothetical protein